MKRLSNQQGERPSGDWVARNVHIPDLRVKQPARFAVGSKAGLFLPWFGCPTVCIRLVNLHGQTAFCWRLQEILWLLRLLPFLYASSLAKTSTFRIAKNIKEALSNSTSTKSSPSAKTPKSRVVGFDSLPKANDWLLKRHDCSALNQRCKPVGYMMRLQVYQSRADAMPSWNRTILETISQPRKSEVLFPEVQYHVSQKICLSYP